MDALQRANHIRVRRAQLKRELKSGDLSIVDVVWEPPTFLETAKVVDLLLAVPRFGRVKANKVLGQARISPSKTLGGLSERQRLELIELMGGRPPGTREVDRAATARFSAELGRLLGDREPEPGIVERAARLAAAEQSWRSGLGTLLSREDVLTLLAISAPQLDELEQGHRVVVLVDRDGHRRYPAYQFPDGGWRDVLGEVHRLLTQDGHLDPWSAAAWAQARHPELEGRSPAQWAAEHRDEERLRRVASRDAAALAR